MMDGYVYGYYVAGNRNELGTVTPDEYNAKKREIDYANKLDPGSRWFIEYRSALDSAGPGEARGV